eukprot:scaffold5320_cov138-Isochrysis_galbana.AAC.2
MRAWRCMRQESLHTARRPSFGSSHRSCPLALIGVEGVAALLLWEETKTDPPHIGSLPHPCASRNLWQQVLILPLQRPHPPVCCRWCAAEAGVLGEMAWCPAYWVVGRALTRLRVGER